MRMLLLAATAALVPAHAATAAPVFLLNDTGGVGAGTQARAGFEAAAARWARLFSDDVVIRLDVGFRALGSGILGQAGSTRSSVSYTNVRAALRDDRTSANDGSAYDTTDPTLTFYSNEAGNCATGVGCRAISPSSVTLDNDGTRDNLYLNVNTANQKVLGLRGDTGSRDASITFNTAYNWNFSPDNGVSSGTYDFIGVAAHEIGHALGFVSGVDLADVNVGATGLDKTAWGTPLDLFRFVDGRRSWTIGGTPCLGTSRSTCIGALATGSRHGDGRQASHWKDNRGIGIMDPTASAGERLAISMTDLIAFDIIGWDLASQTALGAGLVQWVDFAGPAFSGQVENLFAPAQVPAPGMLSLLGFGALGLMAARRAR